MFGERELRMDGHRLQRKEAGESKGNLSGVSREHVVREIRMIVYNS